MTQSDIIARYGVTEASQPRDEFDDHAEQLRITGFTVIDSGLTPKEADHLGGRLPALIRRQEQEFGDREALAAIGEKDTARALLAYDEAFLSLAANPRLLKLTERVLGENFVVNQQNSITLQPGETHGQARFHRDLPYQHFVSSRPLAVNALFCIDEFTVENGATIVIPGSHKHEPFPGDAVVRRLGQAIAAPAGAFIVLDAMTFHRGGVNRSSLPRRGVNHVLGLPFLQQQIDLPALLGGRYSEDPRLRRLLGYEFRPAASVSEWRRVRAGRLRRSGSSG